MYGSWSGNKKKTKEYTETLPLHLRPRSLLLTVWGWALMCRLLNLSLDHSLPLNSSSFISYGHLTFQCISSCFLTVSCCPRPVIPPFILPFDLQLPLSSKSIGSKFSCNTSLELQHIFFTFGLIC